MKIYFRVDFILIVFVLFLINAQAQQTELETDESSLDSLLNIKVSTAVKYWQTVSEAPASVTIITAAQIERYGYRTLDDVLNSVRGFYVSNDRNYSYVGVRGFSRPTDYNDRLLLLFDGHTLNENVYGSALTGSELPIDLGILDRIEIVRGPGSALYGTGAMFAVVNLIPKKGKDIDGLTVSTEVGSYGRIGGAVIFGKQYNENFDLLLSAVGADIQGNDQYYSEFDDSSTNFGVAANLDWERYTGFLASVRYKSLTLQTIFTSRTKSVPTGAFETLFNTAGFESIDKYAAFELKIELPLTIHTNFFARGYYDYYDFWGSYPYPTIMNFDASLGKWLGSEAQFRWDMSTASRFTIGAEFKHNPRADYRNWTMDTVYFNKNFPFNAFSVYIQNEFQILDNVAVIAGIRRDEFSSTGSSTIPRAAIIFNPISSSTLKLLYGVGFRAPNIYEENFEDDLSQWEKNTDLRSEKITTTEIVYEQRFSNSIFGVLSLYSYRMDDLIDSHKDSAGISQFQNISEVKATGIETEFNFRTDFGLNGSISGSYQRAIEPSSTAQISNSPSYTARLGLSYKLFKDIIIGNEFIYNSERITVYQTTTDPLFLTKLNVIARPRVGEDAALQSVINHLELSLLVNNVFDASFSTPGGIEHTQYSIPQDGRTFRFKVSYTL